MSTIIKYFAYGSNLDLEHLAALKVQVHYAVPAKLFDYILKFNVVNDAVAGGGYANIVPKKGAIVEGALIFIESVSLKYLDDYEGFPVLYKKAHVSVFDEKQQAEEALVYVGDKDRLGLNLRPSKSHLRKILNGEAFFSKAYFGKLSALRTV